MSHGGLATCREGTLYPFFHKFSEPQEVGGISPHFSDDETEAQRIKSICLRSGSWEVAKKGPDSFLSGPTALLWLLGSIHRSRQKTQADQN